jgi:drug/metabolite transporter (DMT)-like permease
VFELKPFAGIDEEIDSEKIEDEECNKSTQEQGMQSSTWVLYSMVAALLLALCNTTMSDLSSIGIEGLLYLSPGNLICGIMFCSVEHMLRTFKGQEGGLTPTASECI